MSRESDPATAANIGKQMLAMRVRMHLTQKEAAKRVGLHWNQWAKYERGEREAPLRLLQAIEKHLGTPISIPTPADIAGRGGPTHPPEYYKGMLEAGRLIQARAQAVIEDAMDGLSAAAVTPSADRLHVAAAAVAVRKATKGPQSGPRIGKRTG
jgi:transcriptional regulator with XRE-family HTH domain